MKKRPLLTLLLISFGFLILAAQDGLQDFSFGNNGFVVTDLNNSNDVAQDILVQADGKILVTGYTSDGIKDFFCLIRYRINGSLDTGFGNNGIVVTAFPFTGIAASIALQTDGRILIGGHTWQATANVFALVRYLPDGSLDTDFGDEGKVTTPFPDQQHAVGRVIAIQTDAKIIMAGHVYTYNNDADNFALARYHPNGTLDQSFGNAGLLTTAVGAFSMDWINDLKIQADDKIVVAGFSDASFALARYRPDGSLDTDFGLDGLLTTSIPNAEQGVISAIQIQADGKILGAGFIRDSFSDFALVRYHINGDLDSSFGLDGIATTQLSDQNDAINAIEIQADGKIIAGGTAFIDTNNQFTIARYNDDGSLDVTFGNNGLIEHSRDFDDTYLTGGSLQTDGKMLFCGYRGIFPYDFILSRYTSETVNTTNLPAFPGFVSLYPNPARDFITLEYKLNESYPVFIKLLDAKGSVVKEILNNENSYPTQNRLSIKLADLPAGGYFISMEILGVAYHFKVIRND